MAAGTSITGLIASSLNVEIKSNPITPKKTTLVASTVPFRPRSSMKKGLIFYDLNYVDATTMITISAAIFARVSQVLNFSDSRVPQQLMPQRIAMKITAKGQQSSTPNTVTE